MITQEIFARGMTAFQDRFRPMHGVTLALYYDAMRERLSDREFMIGIERSLSWTGYGVPGPEQIIELARPSQSVSITAEQEYERVMQSFRDRPWQHYTIPLSGSVRHAVLAAGGAKSMALADEGAAPHIRRAFVKAFTEHRESDDHMRQSATFHALGGNVQQVGALIDSTASALDMNRSGGANG